MELLNLLGTSSKKLQAIEAKFSCCMRHTSEQQIQEEGTRRKPGQLNSQSPLIWQDARIPVQQSDRPTFAEPCCRGSKWGDVGHRFKEPASLPTALENTPRSNILTTSRHFYDALFQLWTTTGVFGFLCGKSAASRDGRSQYLH